MCDQVERDVRSICHDVAEPHHDHSVDTLAELPLAAWKRGVAFVLTVDKARANVLVCHGEDPPEQPEYFGVTTHNQHMTVAFPPRPLTKKSFEAMINSWEKAGTTVSHRQILGWQ